MKLVKLSVKDKYLRREIKHAMSYVICHVLNYACEREGGRKGKGKEIEGGEKNEKDEV